MGLARLGVGKLILIDKELVELGNLNRQILYSHRHIGLRKVDAAESVLRESHLLNPDMQIESHHVDALKAWPLIVSLCKQATVVFNMIDVGEYFDAAVMALCM